MRILDVRTIPLSGATHDTGWPGGTDPNEQMNTLLEVVADSFVSDYVPNMDLDVWQQVTIPIADFALGADVDKLVIVDATKGGQQFYLDTFELIAAGAGGPYTFRAEAPANERWHVGLLNMIVSAGSTGWNSSAFANIAGGLAQGLILRKKVLSTGEVLWSFTFKNNVELFGQPVPSYDFTFANSELMVNFSMKPDPATLIVTADEVLVFLVRDNLSSLTNMRAYIDYGKEMVEG